MGFFDFVTDAWDGVRDAATSVYDSVIEPVGSWVGGAAKTAYGAAESLVNRVVNKADRFAVAGINAFEGFNDLLSSPIFLIGGIVVAVVVLPQILK